MTPKTLFLLGYLHLTAAALVGVALAGGLPVPVFADLLLAVAGLALVAAALAFGYAGPFLKREVPAPDAAWAMVALLVAADAALAWRVDWAARGVGLAIVALPLHVAATAAFGKPWRGGIAIFAKDQPFRRGDALAAAAFALGLLGLLAGGVLLALLARGIPTAGIAVALLGGVLPFLAGMLLFFLPRNAKTPLPGATLVGTALGVWSVSTVALGVAFTRPVGGEFRAPAIGALLAIALFQTALLRLRFGKPGVQLLRARPFLRGAAALAPLTGVTLALSMAGGLPGPLLPVAAYAFLVLGALLAVAATLLGAPILLNSVPRAGRWGMISSALGIAGLFLLAPAFQYPRPPVFGAIVLAVAMLVAVWGLAPMRTPRRDCPPD